MYICGHVLGDTRSENNVWNVECKITGMHAVKGSSADRSLYTIHICDDTQSVYFTNEERRWGVLWLHLLRVVAQWIIVNI